MSLVHMYGSLCPQMTVYDAMLFGRLEPIHLLDHALHNTTTQHLHSLIERFNHVYAWVQREITASMDAMVQAFLIRKFIKVNQAVVP